MGGKVFVLGSFAVDASYRASRMPAPGETVLGVGFSLSPGGKGSNQAVAAARAGSEVTLLTATGSDAFAEIGRSTWKREGVLARCLEVSEEPTGSAAILVHAATGENAIVMVPGACGRLSAADVEAASPAIAGADVLLAQLEVPKEVVWRGLAVARATGVQTVLNPAPVPREALAREMLELVEYLVPNETEAMQLLGADSTRDISSAAQQLCHLGCGNVLVTLAERGSLLCRSGEQPVAIPAFSAGSVVDTTGAGDAFCGAFATALAEGKDVLAAATFASAAAGISVTRQGAALAAPYRQEIDELCRKARSSPLS